MGNMSVNDILIDQLTRERKSGTKRFYTWISI